MSSFETQSYVFDLRDALGSGAFGAVCVGYQRVTGEPVAVKVFKRNIPQRYLSQEFEVLKCVDHENIVRLISVERHPKCGSFVVMELCAEGSLLNVLQSPQNLYGLDEEEFLILLGDLTAGMKYLRGKNLIHRDIKPGNILRSRRCDGRFIYKLIDFGSARVLEDDESFSSIWGTAEYLHPDIYEAHKTKRKTTERHFSATVDLWSIGVTLYHAATGEVPFKPPEMLSAKPKGVISGEKAEPNGPIMWKEELPQSCRWNPGFKVVITRLLRGLLEAEPALTWSFERFFSEVDEIGSLKKLVVFHVNLLRFLEVYLKPDENLPQLEEAITRQTSLKSDEQLLAYKCKLLRSESGADAPVLDLLSESPTKSEPIILLGAIEPSKSKTSEWAGLNFLNTDPSQSPETTKQLMANEYLNESVIDDLIVVNSLCKTAGWLYHNILSQQRKACQLKIDCLIKLWRTLKRDARNKPRHAEEVKNLEQFKARAFASLELALSAGTRATLQDKDGIFKAIDDTTREMKTLQAKLRVHRNSFLKSKQGENHIKLLPVYLHEMTKELTRLYSACEAQTQTLANHVNAWCVNVAVVFGAIGALEEYIDEWGYHSEKLADSLCHVTKDDEMALSERLVRLEAVCKETADLVESQSSIIQNVISVGDKIKISDDLERQDDSS